MKKKEFVCAISQPNYIPWAGYFSLIKNVETFIFLDDVKYIKREWKNRNKIRKSKNSNEFKWLSISIDKMNQEKNLNECEICDSINWRLEHINSIKDVYSKAPYFSIYFKEIESIIKNKNLNNLADLNINLINYFCNILNIKTKKLRSSQLNCEGTKDIKLIALCNKIKANKYIANNKSENYINEDNFRRHNITLEYQNYNLKQYLQFSDKKKLTHIPYLSIVDLIFNHGDESNKYI